MWALHTRTVPTVWVTRDLIRIPIRQLTDQHIANIITLFVRRAPPPVGSEREAMVQAVLAEHDRRYLAKRRG